jgi:tetratricopeptide (TPR) repeat protein
MSWAGRRKTTREEDQAYSLLGIFDINIPVIYGEEREKALKRLREEIDKASTGKSFSSITSSHQVPKRISGFRKLLTRAGSKHEDFSVVFNLSDVPAIEHFVARKDELSKIHRTFKGDGSRRAVILHGLGGIGKTQLTVAYAKRHKDDYSAIFWLNIKDEDSLKQSFVNVAKRILRDHPSASRLSNVDTNENLDEVVNAVKAWLNLPNNTRWLLIYDNYDNPKVAGNADPASVDIRKFLPESYQGSIIITTRSSQVEIGIPIQVRKLGNVGDSLVILSNASRREELMNGMRFLKFFITALTYMLDPDAVRLAEELDGFPLALATAGAYLNQVSIDFADYLWLYKTSWAKLQKMSPELGSYEDRTLYSTWQISFDYVEQRNPLSAKLLRLWAYFDNQDLWFELLRHADSKDPEWIGELTEDELSFHDAMRVLSNHGLVEVATSSEEWIESKGYSIHGCVHSWTVHVLNHKWDYDLAKVAVKFVGAHAPGEQDIRPWLTQRRLLQHAARCSYVMLNGLVLDNSMEWAYHQLGILYRDQGKLTEAEQMFQRALQGCEKALGTEHT